MALLHPRYIFGLKSDVKDNAWYLEENVVLYPAGNNVIIYHTDTKSQDFIQASEGGCGITALAVSSSRQYVAIAEKGQRGSVSIYDWHSQKKRKVLTSTEISSEQYVSMCFSSNKLLLTLGGAPDWTLILWQWEKAKVLATVKVSNTASNPLTQCSFNPVDPSIVCVTGEGIFKAFRIVDNVFKSMPHLLGQMEPKNFTSHLWLNDNRVMLGTGDGSLILFEAGEFLAVLECSPNNDKEILCMSSLSNGFLVGCQGGGVHVFIGTDDESGYYRETKFVSVTEAALSARTSGCISNAVNPHCSGQSRITKNGTIRKLGDIGSGSTPMAMTFSNLNVTNSDDGACAMEESVVSIAVSPSENNAIVALNNNQLIELTFSSNELLKQDQISTQLLVGKFHRHGTSGSAKITGMDLCISKPLVATCGLDRTVRVWNYVDNRNELTKQFSEEAHSVSFHPSGLHLLVGFSDKLRLMNLLMDDLRLVKELSVKACRECQFSNGGHLFAAVNGNTVQVFNTYSCECIRTMRGHNGKVRSLFWSANDSQLISAGMDGAVYQWDIKENKRDGEYVKKGVNYSTALSSKAGDAMFAVGSDKVLREVEFPVSVVTKEIECSTMISQLVMSTSQRMLFGSTSELDRPGAVQSFKFPLTGDFAEYQALSAPISRMRISWDDQFLFVAGEDGALQIFEVHEKDLRGGIRTTKPTTANTTAEGDTKGTPASLTATTLQRNGCGPSFQYSEETLVSKSNIEEKNALMLELKSKVDELTLHNEYQLRLKDMNYNEKVKEVTEKFTQELEQDKNRYELLREEKNDLEMEYVETIKQVEDKHQEQLQEVEAQYQTKIIAEVERYQQLCHERDEHKTQWDRQQQMLVKSHEQYINEITMDYDQQLAEDKDLKSSILAEAEEHKREFEETTRQLEGDIDKEIEMLRNKFESKLSAEREDTLRFKGENGIMKKKFSALQKDIEVQREDIKSILAKEQDLVTQTHVQEKDIQRLRSEIRYRDETIGDKEKNIYDLKKKNQELEKFKFVLDYKIKELKRQIEPRENEIEDMKELIKEMDHELEQYHKSNASLDVMIGELRTNLDTMQNVIMSNRQTSADQKIKMMRFVAALDECSAFIQNPEKLRDHVKKLYENFVQEQVKTEVIDVDIKREYHRQKDYLKKSSEALKKRLNADMQRHKEENTAIMERNMRLIGEINELREDIRVVKLKTIVETSDVYQPAGDKFIKSPGNISSHRRIKNSIGDSASAKNAVSPTGYSSMPTAITPVEQQLIEEQRQEIGRLKATLAALDEKKNQSPRQREHLRPLGQ